MSYLDTDQYYIQRIYIYGLPYLLLGLEKEEDDIRWSVR